MSVLRLKSGTMDLTVVCVLWVGRFSVERTFNGDWVRRLRAMVGRNLTIPHRFVCLSNVHIDGVECIPLTEGWPAWWAKIELFKQEFKGRVLYLDLDVLVTDSLDEIAAYRAPIAFTPPHSELTGHPLRAVRGVNECYQTSCMVWDPPYGRVIYEHFRHDVMSRLRSDQDWIAEVYPHWPKMPVEWFRKLRQCTQGPPSGVKVVLCMPWKNDEASKRFPWVKRLWQGNGNILGPQSGLAHAGHRGA